MNRYTEIRTKMRESLERKTGWGRNEILALLDDVLIKVAEQEIESAASPPPAEMADAVAAWGQDYFA